MSQGFVNDVIASAGPRSCSELRCAFQQSLVYWQHPSLPWLSLFPRINAERSFTGKCTPWAQDAPCSRVRESVVPLQSAEDQAVSVLLPLLISGIEFSLPLVEDRRKSREQQKHPGEEEEQECSELKEAEERDGEKDEDNDDEDGSFSWLKEIGGTHTFTLINFLINCKSLVAAAGPQAGLPPTLLAPNAFRGATMHTLKARSVNVKSQIGGSYQDISSLEITGPILPSSLHTITNLLRPAQKGNFSSALYTHTPTAVMNTHTMEQQLHLVVTHCTCSPSSCLQSSAGSSDLSACGLHPASIQHLTQPSTLGKTALSHISMINYSYTWRS
ncbi:hypothetical protein F7725_009178 [Dissostichus mawsoni]|uniref:Uncharacterized protein n=1 Tax=Dissostichus mawsoni TaxID=36200 RepID=A0A7J5Z8A0_DISMA|nr:hypothetical protein F7725_009178 [Dissostichus mawsoni]